MSENLSHLSRSQKLARVGRTGAGGEKIEPFHLSCLNSVVQGLKTAENLGQARTRVSVQDFMTPAPPQVPIDQQNVLEQAGERDCRIDRDRGLAFTRNGTGEEDCFGRRFRT